MITLSKEMAGNSQLRSAVEEWVRNPITQLVLQHAERSFGRPTLPKIRALLGGTASAAEVALVMAGSVETGAAILEGLRNVIADADGVDKLLGRQLPALEPDYGAEELLRKGEQV